MKAEDKFITVPEMSTLISENFGINLSEDEIINIVKKLKMDETKEYSWIIYSTWDEERLLKLRGMYAATEIVYQYLKEKGMLPKKLILKNEFPEYCRNLKLNQQ